MGFNYGLEKKNFDRQWAIMRKQYEDAGMSIEVIQAMYEYDWSVFNAARSYQNHTPANYLLINADKTETTVAYNKIQEFESFFELIGNMPK